MRAALISQGSVSSQWTLEAMKKYFDEVDDIRLTDLEVSISGKTAQILHKGEPIKNYHCIYAKGSFRYAPILRTISTILEGQCYMPTKPDAFTVAHDKLLTQLMFQSHNIPMPTTYISSSVTAARDLLRNMNYPIIMKFPQGTQGKGVMFADSFGSASSILDAISVMKQGFIIQEYVETGNSDIRALVVGNKVVASMVRKGNPTEKRANLHAGGVGEEFLLDAHTQNIAVKASKATGAEICGVDILMGHKGPLVIETNISPGLQGITKATRIDVADKIARLLFLKTQERLTEIDTVNKKEVKAHIADESNLIVNIDVRGGKMVLPEIVSKVSGLKDSDQVEINMKKGQVKIDKFDIS